MKKFSKILESQDNRFYKVDVNIELIIESSSEGEAGYISDSIISSIDNISNYQIINIGETSDRVLENKQNNFKQNGKTPEEVIELSWKDKFGDSLPSIDQKMEFYHNMREFGYDGLLIFKSLKGKF